MASIGGGAMRVPTGGKVFGATRPAFVALPLAEPLVGCVYRGQEQLRTVPCELCANRGKPIPVFACAIHGECTKQRYKPSGGLKCCAGCGDKKEVGGQLVALDGPLPPLAVPTPPAEKPTSLITLNIGNVMHPKSRESMQAAAERWGAEYVEITQPLASVGGKPHWQKAFLCEYARQRGFERVAYFDSDILIRSDCPSPFDAVPVDKIGAVTDRDSFGPTRDPRKYAKDRIVWSKRVGVSLRDDDRDHVNGGMIVFTVARHAAIFAHWASCGAGVRYSRAASLVDEMALSAVLKRHGALAAMPSTWNLHRPSRLAKPGGMAAFVYHYAGRQKDAIQAHEWRQGRDTVISALSPASLPVSAVMLHYARPMNVPCIVKSWDGAVSEAAIVSFAKSAPMPPLPAFVRHLVWEEDTLYARFRVGSQKSHECVLIQDDDLILPRETIAGLYARWKREPQRVHGLFGRNPKVKNKALYYADNVDLRDAPAAVVLTRALVVSRTLLARVLDALPWFEQQQANSVPHGNGEDIILSYVARQASGQLNQIHKLPVVELPRPNSISARPNHVQHRTNILRACDKWLHRMNESSAEVRFLALRVAGVKTLYDIGVGGGIEWRDLPQHYPGLQVFGCEPEPVTYSRILRSGFQGRLLQIAISNQHGSVRLHGGSDRWCPSQYPYGTEEQVPVQEVESWTLDEFDSWARQPPDILLWMDIEGAEADALQGASGVMVSGRVKAVVIEERIENGVRDKRFAAWPHTREAHNLLVSYGYQRVATFSRFITKQNALYVPGVTATPVDPWWGE